jgi:hypothetical protein
MAKVVSIGPMTATPSGVVFFLRSIHRSALYPLHGVLFLVVKPYLSSQATAAPMDRVPPLRRWFLSSCLLVRDGRQRCGKEGGGIAEESNFLCPLRAEGGWKEGVGAAIRGFCICLALW